MNRGSAGRGGRGDGVSVGGVLRRDGAAADQRHVRGDRAVSVEAASTGFVITHIGIEVLLLGCLIGARWGTDGRMILRPGLSSTLVELPTEQLVFRTNEQVVRGSWRSTRGLALTQACQRFCWVNFERAAPADATATTAAAGIRRLTIDLLEIAPAARVETRFSAADAGDPAAEVRIFGATPDGVPIHQITWSHPIARRNCSAGRFGCAFASDIPTDAATQRQRARGELVLSPDGQGWRGMILGAAGVRESFAVELGKQPGRAGWG